MKIKITLFATLISWNVLGWGSIGHRAVGLIADANLTPSAKSSVAQLLGGQSLADVSNWADAIKSGSNYLATHWYHFENIPDGMTYLQGLSIMPPAQIARGGAVQAIMLSRDILRAPTRNLSEKSDALKFMVHFIGDIHQPLHTGRPEDKGATTIPVVWFGTKMSLHGVWDSGMILTGHSDIIKPPQTLEEASLAYAQHLVKGFILARGVFVPSDLEVWTNESLMLRPQAYDPTYMTDQVRYQRANLQALDARVLAAGLRLAETLNKIFAAAPVTPQESWFKQQVEKFVGAINKIINLRP